MTHRLIFLLFVSQQSVSCSSSPYQLSYFQCNTLYITSYFFRKFLTYFMYNVLYLSSSVAEILSRFIAKINSKKSKKLFDYKTSLQYAQKLIVILIHLIVSRLCKKRIKNNILILNINFFKRYSTSEE